MKKFTIVVMLIIMIFCLNGCGDPIDNLIQKKEYKKAYDIALDLKYNNIKGQNTQDVLKKIYNEDPKAAYAIDPLISIDISIDESPLFMKFNYGEQKYFNWYKHGIYYIERAIKKAMWLPGVPNDRMKELVDDNFSYTTKYFLEYIYLQKVIKPIFIDMWGKGYIKSLDEIDDIYVLVMLDDVKEDDEKKMCDFTGAMFIANDANNDFLKSRSDIDRQNIVSMKKNFSEFYSYGLCFVAVQTKNGKVYQYAHNQNYENQLELSDIRLTKIENHNTNKASGLYIPFTSPINYKTFFGNYVSWKYFIEDEWHGEKGLFDRFKNKLNEITTLVDKIS